VCDYSEFDLKKYGNENYGAPRDGVEVEEERLVNLKQFNFSTVCNQCVI
jgi:hypothetical protein